MKFLGDTTTKPKWYMTGLAFECQECGRCCAGPEEGYVWVTPDDIDAIAKQLNLTNQQMREQYVRKVGKRYSLVESRKNHDCVFLKPNGKGGSGCSIYQVRPSQCRTWPFWHSNLRDPETWAFAQTRCIGMNRGALHSCEEIEAKRNATKE